MWPYGPDQRDSVHTDSPILSTGRGWRSRKCHMLHHHIAHACPSDHVLRSPPQGSPGALCPLWCLIPIHQEMIQNGGRAPLQRSFVVSFTGTKKFRKIFLPYSLSKHHLKGRWCWALQSKAVFCFLYSEQKHKNLRDESASCVFPR